jgi:hypothetical protein
MEARKITVQVHCPPRDVNGNKFNSMFRCQHEWKIGNTTADLIVVKRKDLPVVSDDQKPAQLDDLHNGDEAIGRPRAVLAEEFQGLVDEVCLSCIILKHQKIDFDFAPRAQKYSAPKKSKLEELEEEESVGSVEQPKPEQKPEPKLEPAKQNGQPGQQRR